MKILHVITSLRRAAGTSVFCMEICDGLKVQGHDVLVAVPNPGETDRYSSQKDVRIVSISSVLNAENGLPYDVVHIHGLWDPRLHQVSRWAKENQIPVVWSPHGMLAPWAMRHKWCKKWLPWQLYQKQDLKCASMFHVTSESERDWIVGLGFCQPCVIAPLGARLSPCIARSSPTDGRKIILFVGRIYPVKNLDALIRAFARIKPDFPDWRVLLVGPDQEGHTKELIGVAKMLGLSVEQRTGLPLDSRIEIAFTGALFGAEKDAAYQMADVFVLPSHTENFGGVVADALAFGVPCIASNKTPWGELEPEGCGLWIGNSVDGLESALRRMMELQDSERKEMGMRGRALVERKYSWTTATNALLAGYNSCSHGGEQIFGEC